ncbi:hypothetical protein [Actinomadura miaoliensis]|uniref:hypothetical protein n=1 Tax=Actinomadura miaoliensis TaxID=430685 RepID=UPI0031EE6E2F
MGLAQDSWITYVADPNLRIPPEPGRPGNKPAGEDLDLKIGWERFEKLVLAVSRRVLGLRGIKFRRYGVRGQTQHGIDLAGRELDGRHTVIQCKDYQEFTAGDLRAAVEKFADGERPFDAYRLIIATSDYTHNTKIVEELDRLQDEHSDLELDLWGAEQINELLLWHADIVARFWTRETAEVFCTGAPLPGVPAPPLDRQEQAERILIGPLQTAEVTPILREADAKLSQGPAESAELYGDLAVRLRDAGFRGHATVLRNRQLDALQKAGLTDDAAGLAAHLAAIALHHGDRHEPRILQRLLESLARDAMSAGTWQAAAIKQHARLIRAAVATVQRPLGPPDVLREALTAETTAEPGQYRPLLVLLLAEDLLATAPDQLPELDDLINEAIAQAAQRPISDVEDDIVVRLRLIRAEYDAVERRQLLGEARRHRVPGRHAALISAREARRCALEGRAEDAVVSWRDAVHDSIHAGLTDAAADWLYALRAVHIRYGLRTTELDEEHHLAQGLRAMGTGRLLNRFRNPKEQAMSAWIGKKPIEAVLSARRWLIDNVVTGSWTHEIDALELLADLYRENREPALAALHYQRAGKSAKLTELAKEAGDLLLPAGPLESAPWWVLHSRAALVAAQADLLDDRSAAVLLGELTEMAARGRAGELADSPNQALTLQAARSACTLAARGTAAQATALLELLSQDVHREPGHYWDTDDQHAAACVRIARAHPSVAMVALTRLFDLADQGVDKALELLAGDEVLALLGAFPRHDGYFGDSAKSGPLTGSEQSALRARAIQFAEGEHYLADVVGFALDPGHPFVRERAEQARDRILNRLEPAPGHAERILVVSDSYLVSGLSTADQRACLEKLLDVAEDVRELATNRQSALTGARNLVAPQPEEVKRVVFSRSSAFVLGKRNGSRFDELMGNSHPLSWFKADAGSASLRGHGLRLAMASATTDHQRQWVREQAVALLSEGDASDMEAAAVTLAQLPSEITAGVNVNLLSAHNHVDVRCASAVLYTRRPRRYHNAAMRLAKDRDARVRRTLAEAAAKAPPEHSEDVAPILAVLAHDARHSVRTAVVSPAT